jgi:hypothetical protein
MDWITLITAALAGGFAGQLLTLLVGHRITARHEFANWLRCERFKVFSELVDLTSSSDPKCGIERWPSQLRALCQRVYLLHKNGDIPDPLYYAMENVFQLTYQRRHDEIKDMEKWKNELRAQSNTLRTELARSLHARYTTSYVKPITGIFRRQSPSNDAGLVRQDKEEVRSAGKA